MRKCVLLLFFFNQMYKNMVIGKFRNISRRNGRPQFSVLHYVVIDVIFVYAVIFFLNFFNKIQNVLVCDCDIPVFRFYLW